MEWFDAANKLPEDNETVLLYMPDADGEKVWPGYFSWSGNADWLLADGMPAGRVTHWGPLPDGPGKLEQSPELKAALRALQEAQEAADFNFEQYQDAGAELCKLSEQCDELVAALSAAREIIMSHRKSFFHCNKNPATGKIEDPCDLAALFDYDRALNLIDDALARFKGTV